jgi:hypothetical protein
MHKWKNKDLLIVIASYHDNGNKTRLSSSFVLNQNMSKAVKKLSQGKYHSEILIDCTQIIKIQGTKNDK